MPLGVYPDVSLKDARERRIDARKLRANDIEHQLAHAVRDLNERDYNRTARLPERRKMMQEWTDHRVKLKPGASVIRLHEDRSA